MYLLQAAVVADDALTHLLEAAVVGDALAHQRRDLLLLAHAHLALVGELVLQRLQATALAVQVPHAVAHQCLFLVLQEVGVGL